MKDLKARAALKLGVSADELHEVVVREDVGWPAVVVVIYSDYRKVKFPLDELPELAAAEAADKPAPKPARARR